MTTEHERWVLECRHHWYEFLQAARKAGFVVKDASFEERDGDKPCIELFGRLEAVTWVE